MAEAPQTFSESWFRIANQRISLRPGVKVSRQNYRGQRWIVLENAFSNQFFRLRPAAYEFVARLRPDKTVQEVWQECLNRFPDEAPGQESVIQLLSQLYFANLLQYDLAADSAKLFERYQRTRQRETRSRFLNIMFMRFPLLDPDEFLVRTLPLAKKLISLFGAILWLIVVGWAVKIAVDNWGLLQKQTESVLAPNNLILLYAGLVLVKVCHEFGHAYFCRRFGGEVHVMGVMLMIFTPMPYVDATSSWGFRKRWQRMLVGGAGMIVELFVAALATFVWANTRSGTIHSLAYNMMFVASVSTVIFNINPLLRYDGYYMLSDWLEIPNLYQRSLQQLRYYVERYLFGLTKAESPTPSRKEAFWLVTYGITSAIYRIFVFARILIFVADRLLLIGILMSIVCFISWVTVPIIRLIRYLAAEPRLDRHRFRAVAATVSLIGIILFLLQVVPFPNHFRAPGVIESRQWTQVINEVAGELVAISAQPGAKVTAGQPLLQLKNHELELELAATRASYDEIQARLRQAMPVEFANLKPLQSRLESVTKRLKRLEEEQQSLTIKARHNGVWVAPTIKEAIGRWLVRGTDLGLVIEPNGFEFTAIVAQEDGDSLFANPHSQAEIRLRGESENVLAADNLRIVPAEQRQLPSPALGWASGGDVPISSKDPSGRVAAEPFFEVRSDVRPAVEAVLLHGRSGRIRFDLDPEPLLPRWLRRFRQLLQNRYQL